MICRPARERFPGVVSEAERDLIAPLYQALRHKPVVIRSERAVYDLGELLAVAQPRRGTLRRDQPIAHRHLQRVEGDASA